MATVDAILEAAAHILECGGIAAFNTNALAERAGVSIGSLYQYFPSKEAILVALIRADVRTFEQALQDETSQDDERGFLGRLERLIDVAVDHQLERPQLARILDLEEKQLPLDVEAAEAQSRIVGVIERLIVERGVPRSGSDVRTTALDVLAIARGMIDTAAQTTNHQPDDLKRRVRAAVLGYLANCEPAIANRGRAARRPSRRRGH